MTATVRTSSLSAVLAAAAVLAVLVVAPAPVVDARCNCGPSLDIPPMMQRRATLPQGGNNLCWATTAAMVLSWKEQSSVTIATAADRVGMSAAYRAGRGMRNNEEASVLEKLGMRAARQTASPTLLCDWLKNGPVFFAGWAQDGQTDKDGNPILFSGGGHAVLITALKGTCSARGSGTRVKVNDPWTGNSRWMSFRRLTKYLEGRATDVNLIDIMTANNVRQNPLNIQAWKDKLVTSRWKLGHSGYGYFASPPSFRQAQLQSSSTSSKSK